MEFDTTAPQLPPRTGGIAMSGRRTNVEGTVYYNKSRKRYEGQVTVRDLRTGKKSRRKVSGPTKAKVLELMREVRERGERG